MLRKAGGASCIPTLAYNPARSMASPLDAAYDFFNQRLFDGTLPRCLVTLQRKGATYGYFCGKRFGTRDGTDIRDEIALNPKHFKDRTNEQSLSTLVHEMVHLWQAHFGECRTHGYHNKEWGRKMKEIGLYPSNTGQPGGKETGQKVSHYILAGGPFSVACAELLQSGFVIPYISLRDEQEAARKGQSKTKFTCFSCGTNAWGKPDLKVICAQCDLLMVSENAVPTNDLAVLEVGL
jgi:hypothetical protein